MYPRDLIWRRRSASALALWPINTPLSSIKKKNEKNKNTASASDDETIMAVILRIPARPGNTVSNTPIVSSNKTA